jgi:hypothetical protein
MGLPGIPRQHSRNRAGNLASHPIGTLGHGLRDISLAVIGRENRFHGSRPRAGFSDINFFCCHKIPLNKKGRGVKLATPHKQYELFA